MDGKPHPTWLLVLALAGCSEEPTDWLTDVDAPLPMSLAETGIFKDVTLMLPASSERPYEPEWSLYSSGSGKLRFLHLPDGTLISASSDTWEFPVGTVLSKTFTFPDSEGSPFPIETRLLFRRTDGWDYALYKWDRTGSEARLLEDNWQEQHISIPEGENAGLSYILPGRLDCRTCHETSEQVTGTPVLGIAPYQTSQALVSSGIFDAAPHLRSPSGRTEKETEALGYFIANCTTCHNGGRSNNSSFSLYPDDALESTINRPTEGEAIDGIRIVPGAPEESALYIAVTSAHERDYNGTVKPMPPLGITQADPSAERILRAWIEQL